MVLAKHFWLHINQYKPHFLRYSTILCGHHSPSLIILSKSFYFLSIFYSIHFSFPLLHLFIMYRLTSLQHSCTFPAVSLCLRTYLECQTASYEAFKVPSCSFSSHTFYGLLIWSCWGYQCPSCSRQGFGTKMDAKWKTKDTCEARENICNTYNQKCFYIVPKMLFIQHNQIFLKYHFRTSDL